MSEPILFTVDERRELIRLLDLAVKAGGLQVAQAALYFQQKLSQPNGIRTEQEGQASFVEQAAQAARAEGARRNRKPPKED